MGLIKSVKPEIDLSKVDRVRKGEFLEEKKHQPARGTKEYFHAKVEKNMKVKMQCEYCGADP